MYFQRPSFAIGTKYEFKKADKIPEKINRYNHFDDLDRVGGSEIASIQARDEVDFEKRRAQDILKFGTKVQISTEAISDSIVEKAVIDLKEGLKKPQLILSDIIKILQDQINLSQLSESAYENIVNILSKMNISKDYQDNFKRRIYDYDEFIKKSGIIIAFLINSAPDDRKNKPLNSYTAQGRINEMAVESLRSVLRGNRNTEPRYLDLGTRSVITRDMARVALRDDIDADLPVLTSLQIPEENDEEKDDYEFEDYPETPDRPRLTRSRTRAPESPVPPPAWPENTPTNITPRRKPRQ